MASTTTAPPETTARTAEPLRMTYDEYRDWYDKEAGRRGEWVDGEVIVFVSTTPWHGRIVAFFVQLLGVYLELRGMGVVFPQDVELQTREGAAREPDVFVLLNQHMDRVTDRRVVGGADLVVEVISPESVTRDRRDKLAEYAAAGIPEYWLVDPREERTAIEIFALGPESYYQPLVPEADGLIHSLVLPGVWADPSWISSGELPNFVRLGTEMAAAGDSLQTSAPTEN